MFLVAEQTVVIRPSQKLGGSRLVLPERQQNATGESREQRSLNRRFGFGRKHALRTREVSSLENPECIYERGHQVVAAAQRVE